MTLRSNRSTSERGLAELGFGGAITVALYTFSDVNGSVYFQRPDGTMLGGACIKASCTQAALTLDAAGTWRIVVQPSGPAMGSISVKLT